MEDLFFTDNGDKGSGGELYRWVDNFQDLAFHTNYVKGLIKTAKNVVHTRWSLHLTMMRSNLDQKDAIQTVLKDRKETGLAFNKSPESFYDTLLFQNG